MNRLTLLLAIISSLIPSHSIATHSMGADLTYECLGNNNYLIRVSFYRDCAGIPAQSFITVSAWSQSCSLSASAFLTPIPGTGTDITPLCPSDTSTCNGGQFTGIQEWIYEGIITFPAQCNDWQLIYEQCCRNGAITTINNPLSEELLIYSMLDNTITPCNNSPVFSNEPVPFVCMGQQFCFNHGAYDVDGDSLVYEMTVPLSYSGIPVQYFPPYHALNPLSTNPSMSFDPATGDFCITPQLPEVTVMAILVREFRNGVQIGVIERDIQITVIPCNNILPTLSGINGTNNFSATICADAPFCFDVFSADADAGQNVTVEWNNAIPGATFTSTLSQNPTGTFCWTPSQADAGPNPHCFTVQVYDNACPIIGTSTYSFCLTVVNVDVNAGPDQTVNCGALASINATGTTSSGNISYSWSNGVSVPSQTVGAGTYTVTATNGQCSDTDAVTITQNAGPVADYAFTANCQDSPVSFQDLSSAQSGTINSWNWNFNDGNFSTQQNPIHQYALPGNYNVCLEVITNLNCSQTICKQIAVNPIPTAAFTVADACFGNAITFSNSSTPPGLSSSWTFGNGSTSNATSPSVNYTQPGNYSVQLIVTNPQGCSDTIQQNANVFDLPVAAFSSTIVDPCLGGQVNFTDNSSPNVTSWNWDFGNGQTSAQQHPLITFAPGTYNVLLRVSTANGCIDSFAQPVTINPLFSATFGPPQSTCAGGTVNIYAAGGISYLWSDGQTTASITVSPATTTVYSVIVTGSNNCTDAGQVTVTVFSIPSVDAGPDHAVCAGDTVTLTASGASTYTWSTGETSQSISASPPASTVYYLSGIDNNGCISSDSVSVIVNQVPAASFQSTAVCLNAVTDFTSTSILSGGMITSWQWDFGDGATSSSENPAHTYSTAGTFNVQLVVTSNAGCADTTIAPVTVHPLPVAEAGADTVICSGNALTIGGATVLGNSYQWSPVQWLANPNSSQTAVTFNNQSLQAVILNYDLQVVSPFGCTSTDQVQVTVKPVPLIDFNVPLPQCLKGNLFFIVPNGPVDANASLSWNFGGDAQPTVSSSGFPPGVSYSSAGFHTVIMQYSYMGCPGNTVIDSVLVYAMPEAGFLPTPFSGCAPLEVTFITTRPDSSNFYTWNIESNISHELNPTWNFAEPGRYQVTQTVTGENGCVADPETATISVFPNPVAAFNNYPDSAWIHHAGIEFENSSTGAAYYEWDFGDGQYGNFFNGQHNYTDTGTYDISLIVISINGCRDTVYGKVRIYEGFSFYVPNAFTPNNDGKNDYFQGYGTFIKNYQMWIYDRWGLMVYHTDDYHKPWDGSIPSPVQSDTYVYRIVVTDFTEKEHVVLGKVTVVR